MSLGFRNTSNDCPYSGFDEDFNRCLYAHSSQELEEWQRRLQYRKWKRQSVKADKVLGYINELLDKLSDSNENKMVFIGNYSTD